MEIKLPNELGEKLKVYKDKLSLFYDRDKFKSFMEPDDDWEHIVSFFVFFATLLALAGAYVYFSVSDISVSPDANYGGNRADAGKVRNAVESINKSEAALNELFGKKSDVSDPSR